jgi:histone H2B
MPPSKVSSKKRKSSKVEKVVVKKDGSKKVRRSSERCYKTYVYKVLKQVHPDTGITSASMATMDSLSHYFVKQLVAETNRIRILDKKASVSSRHVQTAVRLVLPGELAKHAVSEGTKAVAKYNTSMVNHKKGAKAVSAAARAGLQFPPSRLKHEIKKYNVAGKSCSCRVTAGAAVYMAAVVEYLVAEILELSGNASRDFHSVRIKTNYIHLAIANDEELNKFLHKVVFPTPNHGPSIHIALLEKPKRKRAPKKSPKKPAKKRVTKKKSTKARK